MNDELRLPNDIRILSVTSTGSDVPLQTLVNDAVAAGKVLGSGVIIKIGITPSATLSVKDIYNNVALTVAANTTKTIDLEAPLTKLIFTGAATVVLELYYRNR